MTDPYTSLGSELLAAAERQEAHHSAPGGARAWLSHRWNATVVVAVLVLGGGAVAVAATGVLNGAPVKPEVAPSPVTGNGLPVTGGSHPLALRSADPYGGLPWGMRILHTTRGEVCVQVGRVQDGQLGELGVDSAFGDDGRFHALSLDILPPGYGGSSSDIQCVLPTQTLIFEDTKADRSAERLLPEEFGEPHLKHPEIPPSRDLRDLSFGLLGPHAVSVTYRTKAGMHTIPVKGADGAFLIVEPTGVVRLAGHTMGSTDVGGSVSGQANANSVEVMPPTRAGSTTIVSAVTFRFGSRVCSEGFGAPVSRRCRTERGPSLPRRWFSPTRSLHAPVHLTLLLQTHAACTAAFLTDPCYKGEVEFTAPYVVTTAATDYLIEAIVKGCKTGGRPETAWNLERDVRLHETVRTVSLGLFKFTPACVANEAFRVSYQNLQGPTHRNPHESVIVGAVAMGNATLPNGTPMTR
jgi:hypothetical protein